MRTAIKLISLAVAATIIIAATIMLVYKPIYKVSINGEKIGYCKDKETLRKKINEYMEKGEEGQENVAFVQLDDMPEYKMCLLKKGITTNDEEIFNEIKKMGITYYRYYAIADDDNEKTYVASFEQAESTIKELKDKKSKNSSDLTIIEKYETEKPTLSTEKEAVAKLYEKKEEVKVGKNTVTSNEVKYAATGSGKFSTSREITSKKVNLGMDLLRPISGVLTSRYGYRWGRTHTGIDIGAHTGTQIKAAAPGKVTFSGWKGSLGNLVVITHGNGIQTYYGHCSKLLVTAGQSISAGQAIANVGSTGRSTGSHLHFEIRVNGSAINPQSYIGY